MKTIIEPATYSYRNYPSGRFQTSPSIKVYELKPIIKHYRGFEVEIVERIKYKSKQHHRFIIKKINGEKMKIGFCSGNVRSYIDRKIKNLFDKKINGNKTSVENDILFVKYINKFNENKIDLYEVAIGLLINNRYNGKQLNWCFKYLYEKGLPISDLVKFN